MNTFLESSWHRAWQGLSASGTGHSVRDAVVARYSEPHRKYHTIQHLEECLHTFELIRHTADHPFEAELAIWFHDAIYDLRAQDNEARSAVWAQSELQRAGVAAESASRVHELILVTKHDRLPASVDEGVLIDVDLSILGATPERFNEYERQIRQEYSYVPDLLFRRKRRSILQSFLQRPEIYSTPRLHQELETRARVNLASAIAGNAA